MLKNFLRILILSLCYFSSSLLSAKEGDYIPFELKQKNPSATSLSQADINEQVEKQIFDETNQVRAKKKLPAFTTDATLAKAAADHSQDMLKRRYMSHFSPEKKSVVERVQKYISTPLQGLGENIHTIHSGSGLQDPEAIAKTMMQDWIHSPSHAVNIFSDKLTHLGVACANDGKTIYCTQVFSRP